MSGTSRVSFLLIAAAIDLCAIGMSIDVALRSEPTQDGQTISVEGRLVDLSQHVTGYAPLPEGADPVLAVQTEDELIVLGAGVPMEAKVGDRVRASGQMFSRSGVKYLVVPRVSGQS